MSVNEHETHAAVVADIHKIAERFHEDYLSDPVEFKGYERIANEFSTLASRFEAAHKREVDALTAKLEEARHCWRIWSDRADELKNKCNEQYAKLKTVGNVAKLREAAKYVQSTMEGLRDPTDKNNAEFIRIWEIVSDALAAPPRNCDIPAKDMGEWCDRFYDYVRRNNPACIRTSPLYTYHDAMKWMLDEANTNKEA